MNHINFIRTLAVVLVCTNICYGQQTTNSFAIRYATKVAQRMKDSLNLTQSQQTQIYDINMNLETQNEAVFSIYTNRDIRRTHLQAIEDTRDSLYHTVLIDDKYQLYLQKKSYLLNNN